MSNDRQFPTEIGLDTLPATYAGPKLGVDVVQWNGPCPAKFVAFEKKFGERTPFNPQFRISVVLQGGAFPITNDKGEVIEVFPSAAGALITGTKPIGGKDKNGEPNERNIADMLVSGGCYTVEQIKQITQLQQTGQMAKWKPDEIIAMLSGRTCYVDVGESWDDDGKPYSNIDGFMSQAQHDEKMKTPALYRQHRSAAPSPSKDAKTVGAGALGTPPISGPGATMPTGLQSVMPGLQQPAQPMMPFAQPTQSAPNVLPFAQVPASVGAPAIPNGAGTPSVPGILRTMQLPTPR